MSIVGGGVVWRDEERDGNMKRREVEGQRVEEVESWTERKGEINEP